MSQVGGGFRHFCLLSAGKWGRGSGASQTWIEFVVGSHPCSVGISLIPLVHKNKHSKFQFDLETVDRKSHLMERPPLNPIIIMMAATIPLQIYGDYLCFAQRTWKEWWVFVHIILRWPQDCSRSVSTPVFVSSCKNVMTIYDYITNCYVTDKSSINQALLDKRHMVYSWVLLLAAMGQVLCRVSSDHYLMICLSCYQQPMTFPPFHQRLVCLKLFQCPLQPVEPTTVKKKLTPLCENMTWVEQSFYLLIFKNSKWF